MKSQYATAHSIAVCSLVTNIKGETLIGFDEDNHIVIPYGVQQAGDKGNPHTTLHKAEMRLFGKALVSTSSMESPLVICTSAKSGNVAADPVPGQRLNLIYVYRKVLLGESRLISSSREFRRAGFVPESFFKSEIARHGKMTEVINRARSKFAKAGLWPDFANCLKEIGIFRDLENQLQHCRFDPGFINGQIKLNAMRVQQVASFA